MRIYNVFSVVVCVVLFLMLFVLVGEIVYDYFVFFMFENVIIGYFLVMKKLVFIVKLGVVVKIDGGGGVCWGEIDLNVWLKENKILGIVVDYFVFVEMMKVFKEMLCVEGIVNGYLLVGLIYIEGVEVGDLIEVCVFDVMLCILYGMVGGWLGIGVFVDMVLCLFNFVVLFDFK